MNIQSIYSFFFNDNGLKKPSHLQENPYADSTKAVSQVYSRMMNIQPQIVSDDWGKISLRINGQNRDFKDVVISPRDAEEWRWDWSAPSMSHRPGIRVADLDRFILSIRPLPDVVILSQGRGHGGKKENPGPGILKIDPSLNTYLKSKGVAEVHILKTAAAIDLYRQISNKGNKKIAALIHSTC